MSALIYTTICSLDGYFEDADGRFDWAAPDETVHAFVNDLERPVGTYLYGRRVYETMLFWETVDTESEPAVMKDYAQMWRESEKVVYSRTLTAASSEKTRIEAAFEPDAVRRLKRTTTSDISIGGGELAGLALAEGLVDEVRLFVCPIVVGGGKRALPDGVRATLELLDEHRFTSGVVYLRYGVAP